MEDLCIVKVGQGNDFNVDGFGNNLCEELGVARVFSCSSSILKTAKVGVRYLIV